MTTDRALTSGTNARFAFLVVLILVSSGTMMLDVSASLYGAAGLGCGPVPVDTSSLGRTGNLIGVLYDILYDHLSDECLARFQWAPPIQLVLAWPAGVLALAWGLFRFLSRWKARPGRVVPLSACDQDGEIAALLEQLATETGLINSPKAVVNPAAMSANAVVFGSDSEPVVCLNAGLLTRRTSDPQVFRAVLLHELAHVRHKDVTAAYATVALWRVFLALVLVPYAVWGAMRLAAIFPTPYWPSHAPAAIRYLAIPAFLTVLVYLARYDVLRVREVYADRAAVELGASPQGWAGHRGSSSNRMVASFTELWQTHPRWDRRRESLADPAALIGVRGLPMFLTGASSTVITVAVTSYLMAYRLGFHGLFGPWPGSAVYVLQLLAGPAMVSAVAGIALWRAAAYAVLTSRSAPSGVAAGIWLGGGMVAGELLMGQITGSQWLPARPETLVFPLIAGAAFGWWTTRCAGLWASVWRGRTLFPPMVMTLTAGFLLLASWVQWWQYTGLLYSAGVRFNPSLGREFLTRVDPEIAASHPIMMAMVNITTTLLAAVPLWPLLILAAVALTLTPLLAWTVRPSAGAPRWADGAGPWQAAGLVRLRQVFLPVAFGGLVAWTAVAGVQVYLRGWHIPPGHRFGLFILIQEQLMVLAMVLPAAAVALSVSATVANHRLVLAMAAAQATVLLGFVGLFLNASLEGCVDALAVFRDTCGWRPGSAWGNLGSALGMALVLAAGLAIVVTALTALLRRNNAVQRGANPVARDVSRQGVAVYCVITVAVVMLVIVLRTGDPGGTEAASSTTAAEQGSATLPTTRQMREDLLPHSHFPVPRQVATAVATWRDQGGDVLLRHLIDQWVRLHRVWQGSAQKFGVGRVDLAQMRPVCTDLLTAVRAASGSAPIPEPEAQREWKRALSLAEAGGSACEQVSTDDPPDPQLFADLVAARDATRLVLDRLNSMS
ncbi:MULTISPECIES: M48 family metallopeptidase [unclassified Micromonospora]|uniref:M48 family metallopeptidase n=1 Tax=unclassified Micromonospora TaxID=2617518 RepID=UPI0013046007|nr:MULTISPECIES: M48 family metalloprotease [unclassified Micromonospora]